MNDTDTYDEYLEVATEAVMAAADVLEENFMTEYSVEYKSTTDLVSDVDREAEERIKDRISDRYPDHAFFAEESDRNRGADRRWIVDPLDGTSNFVNEFPHYCITIAHEIDGELVVGVTYYPPSDDLYTAVRGGGARVNGEPISVSDETQLDDAMLLMGVSPPTAADERFLGTFRRLISEDGCHGIRRLGAGAADLAWTARGRVDGFFDRYTSPWDVAGGVLFVEEAGGRVTDFEGNDVDMRVGERDVEILATNGSIHDELVDLYEEVARNHPSG